MAFLKETSCGSHSCFPNSQCNISLPCFLLLLPPFSGITPSSCIVCVSLPCFKLPRESHHLSLRVHSLLLGMSLDSFTSTLNLEVGEYHSSYPFPHSLSLSLAGCWVCRRHALGPSYLQGVFMFQSLPCSMSSVTREAEGTAHL